MSAEAPTPASPAAAASTTPTPAVLAQLAAAGLTAALDDVADLSLACNAETCTLIDEEDLFGYAAQPPYHTLYTIATDASGGAYHIWLGSGSEAVVYLGSEGERAKVGSSASQFLQLALSLAPHWEGAVSMLPARNTLPDNGDIDGATLADFDRDGALRLIATWSGQGPSPFPEGSPMAAKWPETAAESAAAAVEAQAKADVVLATLGLPRLSVEDALTQLAEAHLALPRFAIRSEDDLEDE